MQPLEIDSAVFCDGAHYTADPCLVARLAAEARERSLSLTDPETQARGAKRAAGSTAQGEAAGRGPAL